MMYPPAEDGYLLDVEVTLSSGATAAGRTVRGRLHTPRGAEQGRMLLADGIMVGSAAPLGTFRFSGGQSMPCYPSYADAAADAATTVEALAGLVASDSLSTACGLLTITADDRNATMLRVSAIDGVRVRVWQLDPDRGPRLTAVH